jgi:membrane-associated phospholipid phosphatase
MALRPRALLAGAALCAVAFAVLLALSYESSWVRWVDASSLQGFLGLQGGRVSPITERIGTVGNPLPVALAAVALAGVALARGRPRLSVLVLFLVLATSVSSQALKALLAYPRYGDQVDGAHVDPAAFPSGHATASLTLGIALVLVVSPKLRPLAAVVGAALAVAVSFSVVSMGWHYPSDIIGGFLLATAWTLVLLAALRVLDDRYPERTARSALVARSRTLVDGVAGAGLTVALVVGAVGAVGVTVAVVAFRLSDLLDYVQEHTAFVGVAALLTVSALALLGVVTGALARRPDRP